jgi:uncharacterized membrane protein
MQASGFSGGGFSEGGFSGGGFSEGGLSEGGLSEGGLFNDTNVLSIASEPRNQVVICDPQTGTYMAVALL